MINTIDKHYTNRIQGDIYVFYEKLTKGYSVANGYFISEADLFTFDSYLDLRYLYELYDDSEPKERDAIFNNLDRIYAELKEKQKEIEIQHTNFVNNYIEKIKKEKASSAKKNDNVSHEDIDNYIKEFLEFNESSFQYSFDVALISEKTNIILMMLTGLADHMKDLDLVRRTECIECNNKGNTKIRIVYYFLVTICVIVWALLGTALSSYDNDRIVEAVGAVRLFKNIIGTVAGTGLFAPLIARSIKKYNVK